MIRDRSVVPARSGTGRAQLHRHILHDAEEGGAGGLQAERILLQRAAPCCHLTAAPFPRSRHRSHRVVSKYAGAFGGCRVGLSDIHAKNTIAGRIVPFFVLVLGTYLGF